MLTIRQDTRCRLKHQKNCGNDGYKKAQLITARAYRIVQGDEPECSTVGLTNALDIAEREYDLGFLEKKSRPSKS